MACPRKDPVLRITWPQTTLEIHKPELARRVQAQIQSGQFHDTDELIEKAGQRSLAVYLDLLDRTSLYVAPQSMADLEAYTRAMKERQRAAACADCAEGANRPRSSDLGKGI